MTKCIVCNAKFSPAREDARYCSARCRQRARRARVDRNDIDQRIEQARLSYWALIVEKARALGRSRSQILTAESQYVDLDGNVWVGGVFGNGAWRLAGKLSGPSRPGWSGFGIEAAGPPWAPPGPPGPGGFYESAILGRTRVTKCDRIQEADHAN